MTYGYLRVSTVDQDCDKFKDEILRYSNSKDLGRVVFVDEKINGKKNWKERKLGELLINKCNDGDRILVPELSRISRSVSQTFEIITYCQEKGIELHILKQNLIIKKELDMTTKIMLSTFAMISELERDYISLRVRESMQAYKKLGKHMGRKVGSGLKLQGKESEIISQLKLGVSVSRIALNLGVNRLTVDSFIKKNKLK